MTDVRPPSLSYQPRPRQHRIAWAERLVDILAISLALLWPIWAFFVTRYCTAHGGAMTSTGTLLIVATVALPIGFGVIVCYGTSMNSGASR